MARRHWLMKTEPETYSWQDLVGERRCVWDGVRNYQARNNMREMAHGDMVLIYHSGSAREVVGVARVIREAYPDPTTDDPRWSAVDLEPIQPLRSPVSLSAIRDEELLQEIPLVRHTRLSVMPLRDVEFDYVVEMSGTRLRRIS